MKEYTIASALSVFLTVLLDTRCNIHLLRRARFYVFLLVILVFKLLVNGYLTGEGIVQYNSVFFLGIRVASIPMEDFLFGFSMVTLTILFWECGKRRWPLR